MVEIKVILENIWEGLCKELQFIIIGTAMLYLGLWLPNTLNPVPFVLAMVGYGVLLIGLYRAWENWRN